MQTIGCSSAVNVNDFDKWLDSVEKDIGDIVCKHESDANYFAIAKDGSTLRVAYRIDIDNNNAPESFIFSWMVTDMSGKFLLKETPEDVRRDYIVINKKYYAEVVQSLKLHKKIPDLIKIAANVTVHPMINEKQENYSSIKEKYGVKKYIICSI